MSKRLNVGDVAPDFRLPSQTGGPVSLKNLIRLKEVVLYFYPKDFTLGCTAEACAFRDTYEAFKERGAEVVGVSSDSTDSHKGFASKHNLSFILLSDVDGRVRRLYGASSTFGLPGRVTYVIDRKGIVRHVFSSQLSPKKHVDEALGTLEKIQEAGRQGESVLPGVE